MKRKKLVIALIAFLLVVAAAGIVFLIISKADRTNSSSGKSGRTISVTSGSKENTTTASNNDLQSVQSTSTAKNDVTENNQNPSTTKSDNSKSKRNTSATKNSSPKTSNNFLTKEDGAGTLYINMRESDFLAKLKQLGIGYKKSDLGNAGTSYTVKGVTYQFSKGRLYMVDFIETPKGLKIGDILTKAFSLYGNDYQEIRHANMTNYVYRHSGNISFVVSSEDQEHVSALYVFNSLYTQ